MIVRLLKPYTWRERFGALVRPLPVGDYIVGEDITEEAADGAIAAGIARRIPEKGDRQTKRVA